MALSLKYRVLILPLSLWESRRLSGGEGFFVGRRTIVIV